METLCVIKHNIKNITVILVSADDFAEHNLRQKKAILGALIRLNIVLSIIAINELLKNTCIYGK